jgi:predicted ferric reductase
VRGSPTMTGRLDHFLSRVAVAVTALAFVLGPLLLARQGGWPGGRSFVAELSSSLGIVALGVLGLLLVLPSRLPQLQALGADAAVRLHRRLAVGLVALVAAHVFLVVAAAPARVALFEFVGQPWRAQAAIGSTLAMLLLGFSSVHRRRLRLSYATWRALHGALAVGALVLAVAHTVGWHRYLMTGVGRLALIAVGVSPILAVARLRIHRHRRLREQAYVVEQVVAERGNSATLQLYADGHRGAPFRAGQFAWIKLDGAPLGIDEHPFSYSSSAARSDRPSFTIRAYDGFSAHAAQLTAGTRVLVDGPHGAFFPCPRAPGMVLVAAGIGITPIMSILRTAADHGDPRRFVVVYANRSEDGITFREELDALRDRLRLDVHHILSRPDPAWGGHTGRITSAVLAAVLPPTLRGWQFFLCGSGPAVATALNALTQLGVPPERIHAERFIEV